MKLGLGLYHHMLTAENYRFAWQCGCTHIVAHLTGYFDHEPRLPEVAPDGWGRAGDPGQLLSEQELIELRRSYPGTPGWPTRWDLCRRPCAAPERPGT